MYGHELFVWGVWTGGSSMKEGNGKALLPLLLRGVSSRPLHFSTSVCEGPSLLLFGTVRGLHPPTWQ